MGLLVDKPSVSCPQNQVEETDNLSRREGEKKEQMQDFRTGPFYYWDVMTLPPSECWNTICKNPA